MVHPDDHGRLGQPQRAEQTNVSLPRVYVTPSSHVPESRGASNGEAYVRMTRLQRDLKGEILRLRVRWAQGRLRMTAEQRVELPILARRAIDVAARTRPPIRTVSELASRLTCSRSALWKAWKGNRAREARLEDLLDWLLLVESIWLKASGLNMAGISDRLRVHEHTIARIAARLTARTLSELEAFPQFALSTAVVEERIRWFLGDLKSTKC